MADNTEMQEMNNFSIQDTMSMGVGSQQLLNDLLAPETGTGSADDLTPIIKEVEEPAAPAVVQQTQTIANKNKVTTTPNANKGDDVEEKPNPSAAIMDFLGSNNSNEENADDTTYAPTTLAQEPTDPEPANPDDEPDTSGTQFSALAKDLFSLGVFTSEDGVEEAPITSPEEFLERFNAEKQKGSIDIVNNFIGQFGEDYQNAFQAIFVHGADPREYFQALTAVEDFSTLDMTQESNQKLVLQHSLRDQGFEEEDINAEIERLTNYGDLSAVASRNHKVLVKKQAANLEKIASNAQKEIQQKAAIRNEYINNVQTIIGEKLKVKAFDGIPLNPKLANELHDFLLVDKYKTPTGETLTDFDRTILELKRPENHAMKVKIGLLLKILEKDPTLSTIQKTGVTSKTNAIFSEVVRQGAQPKPQQAQKEAASRWFK
jgi:hypothetical protein